MKEAAVTVVTRHSYTLEGRREGSGKKTRSTLTALSALVVGGLMCPH